MFLTHKIGLSNQHADYCTCSTTGEWLHDFYVGVTDINPSEVTPTPGDYNICYLYSGASSSGDVMTLTCLPDASGRYLIIQIPGNNEYLLSCEIEVYGIGEYFILSITIVLSLVYVYISQSTSESTSLFSCVCVEVSVM